MSAVVFIGPSIDTATAADELDVEFLPPIARGDIAALLARPEPPTAIGIVDGKFLQSLCVSPKEVLEAIDAGVKVFGSSSMGALRAAECAPFGMVGVGRIFEEYASGRTDADDEVAVVYDEQELTALSEPLINLRLAVSAGLSAEAFSTETGESFLRIAKELYFPQRNTRTVLRLLAKVASPEEHARISAFFADSAPDTKRSDALLLLARMRDYLTQAPAADSPADPAGTALDGLVVDSPADLHHLLDRAKAADGAGVLATMDSLTMTIMTSIEG